MAKYQILLCILFACVPAIVHAQVVITEVMYDLDGSDGGREWLEVFNAGSTPVKLTDFKVVENGSNHNVISVSGGDTLASGAYAVIADNASKFKNDYVGYAGQLFDSAFSLSNSGETIGITDANGRVIDSVTYTNASANGTGDSLQRNSSSSQFEAGIPTPGASIPAGGLQSSAPKISKSAKKSAAKKMLVPTSPSILGESPPQPHKAFVAAVATENAQFLFWLAPLLISLLASAGIVASRHFKKDEWSIVEEVDEIG